MNVHDTGVDLEADILAAVEDEIGKIKAEVEPAPEAPHMPRINEPVRHRTLTEQMTTFEQLSRRMRDQITRRRVVIEHNFNSQHAELQLEHGRRARELDAWRDEQEKALTAAAEREFEELSDMMRRIGG